MDWYVAFTLVSASLASAAALLRPAFPGSGRRFVLFASACGVYGLHGALRVSVAGAYGAQQVAHVILLLLTLVCAVVFITQALLSGSSSSAPGPASARGGTWRVLVAVFVLFVILVVQSGLAIYGIGAEHSYLEFFFLAIFPLLPFYLRGTRDAESRVESESAEPSEPRSESTRLRAEFLAGVLNEVRSSMQLLADPLELTRRTKQPPARETLLKMNHTARRLRRVIGQLADLEEIRAGRMEVRAEGVNPPRLVESVLKVFEPFARMRRVNVVREFGDEEIRPVLGDPELMLRSLYNFLSNALRFTEANDTVTVRIRSEEGRARFEVEDTGPGIGEARLHGLFTAPSEPAESEGAARAGGLGLYLTRCFARLQGGDAGVRSEEGVGSTFWFSVPLAPLGERETFFASVAAVQEQVASLEFQAIIDAEKQVSAGDFAANSRSLPGSSSEYRILVADANRSSRFYLIQVLAKIGYDVVSVKSGEELTEQLDGLRPDLVIADYSLPRVSGLEAIRYIRHSENFRTIPVVLLTPHGDEDTRRRAREAGADSLLQRPCNDLELVAVVRNLLSLKGREKHFVREMEQARRIQVNLLPKEAPRFPNMRIEARFEPMELVGGDLYDFIMMRDGRIGIFVTDVSGHGISAAMIASMVKLILSIFAADMSSPAELLEYLNQFLYGKTAGNYLTCVYAVVSADRKTMRLANAGHPSAIRVRRKENGSFESTFHTAKGRAIGWLPEVRFEETDVDLQAGDRVLFYTDGIIEAYDQEREIFGEERLTTLATTTAAVPLDEMLNLILLSVTEFQTGTHIRDDVTLVGLEIQ